MKCGSHPGKVASVWAQRVGGRKEVMLNGSGGGTSGNDMKSAMGVGERAEEASCKLNRTTLITL